MENGEALFKLHWHSEVGDQNFVDSDHETDQSASHTKTPGIENNSSSSPPLSSSFSPPLSSSNSTVNPPSSLSPSQSTNSDINSASDSPSSSAEPTIPSLISNESVQLVPRGYQLELFDRACKENIIAFLETGAGKTLISALLIKKTLEDLEDCTTQPKSLSIPSRRPLQHDEKSTPATIEPQSKSISETPQISPTDQEDSEHPPLLNSATILGDSIFVFTKSARPAPEANKIALFLVHRVPLVPQQAQVIRSVMKPNVQVGSYLGEQGVDDWSSSKWARSLRTKKVLVMTAQIFLNLLRHGLLDIRNVALLVLDEVHHATKNHPYRRLFVEFYHTLQKDGPRPRIFGMTATPVKAKLASQSSGPCLKAIVALEATLDATVVAVSNKAREEVEVMVPKPEEFVVLFDSANTSIEIDDSVVADMETASIAKVLDKVGRAGAQQPVGGTNKKDSLAGGDEQGSVSDAPRTRPEGRLQYKETATLKWVCSKLGYHAAAYLATELCAVKNISPYNELENLHQQSKRELGKEDGITDKVRLLLDVLFSEYMRSKEGREPTGEANESSVDLFRCIVFVKERITALVLAWLINTVFKDLSCQEMTARSAVGVQNSDSRVRMSQSKLLETLQDFRRGKYGILVATNVVEEGLDVPACRLVTAFDQVMSPSAYVQGRGRARKRGARYIVFLGRGNVKDYNEMFNAREGAKIMSLVANGGMNADIERENHRQLIDKEVNAREKALSSKTTKAQVTATEAVNLLHRYCLMKAAVFKDDLPSKPKYSILQLETLKFTCNVALNPKIPIDGGTCAEPQVTGQLAKRLAALDAYSKLYQVGDIDEFLLPKRPARSKRVVRVVHRTRDYSPPPEIRRRRRRSNREVQSKAAKKDKRLRQCYIIHPSALQSSVELPLLCPSAITSADENSGLSTVSDSKTGLPEAVTKKVGKENSAELDIQCDVAESPVYSPIMLLYSVQVDHSMEHFGFPLAGRNAQVGLVMENKVPEEDLKSIRCPDGEDLITLTFLKEIPWSNASQTMAIKYVRSIQLCLRGRVPGSATALEIEEKDYSKNTVTGFLLVPLENGGNGSGLDIDWGYMEKMLSYGWRCGPPEQNEYDRSDKLENKILCSYHESLDRVYLSGNLNDQLRASSHPKGMLNPLYKSFSDYFERKHNTVLQDNEQIMLEGYSVLDKLCRLSTTTFMLAPETCRVIPLSPMICYVASLLPRWQTFLALRSCWRRNRINTDASGFLSFARALQPNVNNVAKDCADLSYERLEFLGDAVLKVIYSMAAFVMNPLDNEGILSDERDVEVSNQRLADLAMEMKIHNCVAFSGVSQKAKSWPWFWGTNQNKTIQISEKVLADCVEALIGVQYLQGGVELAATFMDRHKLLPKACDVLGIAEDMNGSAGVLVPVPDMGSNDIRGTDKFVQEVEEIIGYTFLDKGHLVVALTHGSFRNGNCSSYQRYEYLGDAIIGFLLLSHFFHKYPSLSPGDLTGLRGPALSNDLFARVIVSLKIHERFWYECPPLETEISKFSQLVANEENEDDDVCKSMTVPKVLGDILESIIGAIVVDKGMRLDGVQEIALRLMEAELERFANPEKFKRNPISELVHLVQKVYNLLPEYNYLDDATDIVKQCAIFVDNREISRASGPTRRVAKHKAAVEGLKKLKEEDSLSGEKENVEGGGTAPNCK